MLNDPNVFPPKPVEKSGTSAPTPAASSSRSIWFAVLAGAVVLIAVFAYFYSK